MMGFFKVSAYVVAQFIVQVPFIFLMALAFTGPGYFLIGLRPGGKKSNLCFIYFLFFIFKNFLFLFIFLRIFFFIFIFLFFRIWTLPCDFIFGTQLH
jgi:hypothetical protein